MLGKCKITANTFQKSLILSPQVEYSHILRLQKFHQEKSLLRKTPACVNKDVCTSVVYRELKSLGGPNGRQGVDKLWQSHAMNVSSQNNGLLNNTLNISPMILSEKSAQPRPCLFCSQL